MSNEILEKFRHLIGHRTVTPAHFMSGSAKFLWEDGKFEQHINLPPELRRKIEQQGNYHKQEFILVKDVVLDLERRIARLEQQKETTKENVTS